MTFSFSRQGRIGLLLGVSAVLATSVGLNIAVFALVNALWLRPVPVRDAERVISLAGSYSYRLVSPILSTFESVAGQVPTHLGLEPEFRFVGVARNLEVMGVTSGYFRLFGLDVVGRDFTENDDREGAEPVAIISDRLWSEVFGRRRDILGTTVAAKPISVRVIGVAPPGFEGAQRGERTHVWIPRAVFPRVLRVRPDGPGPLSVSVWARLAPGDTVAAADRRLKQISPNRSAAPVSDLYGSPVSRTTLLRDDGAGRVVAGLALLVLLGGCAAVGSLLLVHYERRRLELGIRSALGASPARLVRLVVSDLGAIGLAGAIGAVVVAATALRSLPWLDLDLPTGVDLARLDLSLDRRVLAAGAGMVMSSLAFAACLPLVRMTRRRLAGDLLGGPATTASVVSHRVRQGLLALLAGATAVVLVSATLFIRSVDRAFGQSPGFDVERLLFAAVPVTPPVTFKTLEFQGARGGMVRAALRGIPGVEGVAFGDEPISAVTGTRVRRLPRTIRTASGTHELRTGSLGGSPDLLATLGVPIVAGRGLTTSDLGVTPLPLVVTASVARKLWPAVSPLGQHLGANDFVIVGIARDFAYGSVADPADGVFVRAEDDRSLTAHLVVRTRGSSAALIEDVRRVLRETLVDTPAATVVTGRELLSRDLARQRLGAWFFSAFGLVALGVGLGSVFGMVAYLAESRRREFGVRLALGATHRHLVRYGLVTALLPVGVGSAVGLVVAAGMSRMFGALLVGISPLDGLTYAAVAAVLLCSAAGAALVAAWRFRRVAPTEALRTT